jgi:hypothetical protein
MLRLLRTWGVLMIFEEKNHFFKNFLFKWNGMVMIVDILAMHTYSRMGLCTPIQLNQNYRDVGVVDIAAVDAYSGVEVCTPIFLGEASK